MPFVMDDAPEPDCYGPADTADGSSRSQPQYQPPTWSDLDADGWKVFGMPVKTRASLRGRFHPMVATVTAGRHKVEVREHCVTVTPDAGTLSPEEAQSVGAALTERQSIELGTLIVEYLRQALPD